MPQMYICNIKTPSDHCKDTCLHGKPHKADECTTSEFCGLICDHVKCRRIGILELRKWEAQNEMV